MTTLLLPPISTFVFTCKFFPLYSK